MAKCRCMMKFGKKHSKDPDIGFVPKNLHYVNIIFLLLVFFIMEGSFGQVKDELVTIPYSNTASPISNEAVVVTLTATNIYYAGKVVSVQSLQNTLINNLKINPKLQVMLKADANLDSIKLLSVLKLLEKSGINNLYMVTTTKV